MIPDTCPYCGAKRTIRGILQTYYACGTAACAKDGEPSFGQSDNCARYVRTRISQLRKMISCAWSIWDRTFSPRHCGQIERFVDACLREIDRLRGAQ